MRFQPGLASAFLGMPASTLLDQQVPLADIWRHDQALPWADVVDCQPRPAALEALAASIAARLATTGQPDRVVLQGARWLTAHPTGSLHELARRSGLSQRQIRRRFDNAIGDTPKKLPRLRWLASQSRAPTTLAALALSAGYADQAPMTREVAAHAGTSPGRLLRDATPRSAVADVFKT